MNATEFFDSIRINLFQNRMTQSQVNGMNSLLDASNDLSIEHRAYIFATSFHETARTMLPVRETLASTDEEAVRRLDRAFASGKLRTVRKPYWRFDEDGKTWLGRGHVQLTHKYNYEKASKELGVDLVAKPDLAMDSDISARIIVEGLVNGWFTKKKLSDFRTYREMRRTVNGMDRADKIALHALRFEAAFLAAED